MNPESETPVKQDLTKGIITNKSDFASLVESKAFVDKTGLIKEVVTSGDNILITCPRRFGKSSNLNMLKTFLEIEVDDEGKEVEDKSQTKNYKLFENLEVAKDQNFMKEHCGQYPVIFVDFLSIKGSSYQEILDGVKTALHNVFKQHKYLSKSPKLAQDEIESFNEYTHKKKHKELDNEDTKTGLQFLSELLHKHFGKKAYVLVDEYDAPVNRAIQKNLDDVDRVNDLIDGILCAVLKSNDTRLERGVMAGISGMVRASAGSGLNNVFHYKFLDHHVYAPYYGFTEAEIDTILKNLNLEHMKEGIENWYDGYRMRTREKKPHIFCPWSILYYLKKGELGNYWEASGSIQNIQAIFSNKGIQKTMEDLIRGEELEFAIDTKLDLDKVKHLVSILNCTEPLQHVNRNLFFSYLFELGYLSNVEGKPGYYRLPNEEIRSESAQRILDYYIKEGILSEKEVDNTIKAMEQLLNYHNVKDDSLEKNVQNFQEALNNLFKPIPLADMRDPEKDGIHPNENFLQVIIGSLAIKLVADNLLKRPTDANAATPPKGQKIGTGTEVPVPYLHHPPRSDIVLVKCNVGIIIELKYNTSADKALAQIKNKNYKNIFTQYTYIPKIKEIGINVLKNKEVGIECELVDNPGYPFPSTNISEPQQDHSNCAISTNAP